MAALIAAVCDRRTDEDDEVRRSQTDATLVGKIIGTPQYMAPEQIEHPSDVDHRADIYALGVVFYQMLTGELPGKELQAPSRKVQIDVRLDEIVLKAMEKNPELRYQQASVMRTRVDDLQAVIPQNEPSKNGTSIPNEKENRTEPFAITSLILGICSLILWPLAALPAIVFGHLARGRIRKNPALKGNGFAIAGLSLGYFFLTVSIVGIIVLALFFNLRSLAIRDEYDPQSAYSARAKASPEAMAEPPKLRFIGLPHPSKERWHPDGTLVTDPHELALMREIGPIYAGGMSKGESIRGMEFWFSHPLLESWHITEVEFLDESGIVAARLGGINGKNKETFGEEGRLNWPIKITPVDISKPLNVRLNYTMGPLERVQEHRVEQNSSGSSFSDGNTRVANWGQTAGGQAFLALSEDKDTQNKHRFGVEAVTKDGAIIQHGSWYSSGSAHTTNITFEFGVPISEVAKFRIGTRRLRSVVWKNVAVSAKNTVPVENETNAVNISGNHPEKKLAEYDWKILAENGRTSDGVPQTLDGRTVLKIENLKDSPMQAHLLTIEKPPIGAMKYALSGEIRYENVQGLAYLEMWSVFPNGRYFSRTKGKSGSGPMSQLAGTSAWREFTLPFDRTGTADAPTRIEVNLFLPGRGVVFMGPLKMIEYGLGKEATDGAETPQTSRSEDAKAQVGDMALPWLAGIDAGDYARSWKDAAEFFQKAVTSEKWSEALTTFRKPLGAVKSRKMRDMKEANTLPGAPDGKYWVMQFDTSFDAKAEAVETVTFMLEKDGAWKAAGYFIR